MIWESSFILYYFLFVLYSLKDNAVGGGCSPFSKFNLIVNNKPVSNVLTGLLFCYSIRFARGSELVKSFPVLS